jgi:hypothetical protein
VDRSVEIEVRGEGLPEYQLAITLTNKSTKRLTIYDHALAWRGWDSILLVAVKADALGTLIEKRRIIDDPGPARITIEPGETLEGRVALVQRFPGFLAALKERDVIVFWSYQLQPVNETPLPRVGGYVLFSRLA